MWKLSWIRSSLLLAYFSKYIIFKKVSKFRRTSFQLIQIIILKRLANHYQCWCIQTLLCELYIDLKRIFTSIIVNCLHQVYMLNRTLNSLQLCENYFETLIPRIKIRKKCSSGLLKSTAFWQANSKFRKDYVNLLCAQRASVSLGMPSSCVSLRIPLKNYSTVSL